MDLPTLMGARRSCSSPFERLQDAERRQDLEHRFLDAFEVAVGSEEGSQLEAAAGDELRRLYGLAIADADDRAPSYIDALGWAARRRFDLGLNTAPPAL